jgi:anoctamin-7
MACWKMAASSLKDKLLFAPPEGLEGNPAASQIDMSEIYLPPKINTEKVKGLHGRKFSNLYFGDREAYLQNNRLSSGELVDVVLVWKLPAGDMDRDHFFQAIDALQAGVLDPRQLGQEAHHYYQREFFENGLSNKALKRRIGENVAKLKEWGPNHSDFENLRQVSQQQQLYCDSHTLKIERELGEDNQTVFVKIHAPIETLMHQAEEIRLVLPLKSGPHRHLLGETPPVPCHQTTCFGVADIPQEETYSAEFRVAFKDRFAGSDTPEALFTPAQRSMLAYRVLQETPYDRLPEPGSHEHDASHCIGIARLLHQKIYKDAFCLHDGPAHEVAGTPTPCERRLLATTWAAWGLWYKVQPLQRIRQYFGEEVAFYFLWLGFYTRMLTIAAAVGLAVFLYGTHVSRSQVDIDELCSSNLVICAVCDSCAKWILGSSCEAYRASWIFDNSATVFFAFFMAVWATLFLEFWKREAAVKAYEWDVADFKETEPLRPEFQAKKKELDPITLSKFVPYFPGAARMRRMIVSGLVVILMLTLVIWAVIGVIMFRLSVQWALYTKHSDLQNTAAAITSSLAAILNLIAINVLDLIYTRLAQNLTDWENFAKQSEYEEALSLKVALFSFVNSYASIAYIAFFKGQFVGRPGDPGTLFGVHQESCPPYGCLLELTIQLAIIMIGNQFLSNLSSFLLPILTQRRRAQAYKKKAHETSIMTRWEAQLILDPFPAMGMFPEYIRMTTQFGFATLFVAAFPLAPLCALMNNILQIRLDAKRLVFEMRRPFAERCADIGVWLDVLTAISYIAVITNAFVIAIPSAFIPKQVYYYTHGHTLQGYIDVLYAPSPLTSPSGEGGDYNCSYQAFRDAQGNFSSLYYQVMMARLAFVIAFEHAVFVLKIILARAIPDVPARVALCRRREQYAAKLALQTALAVSAAPESGTSSA